MKIGPYEVLLELGRGGMGTVYLARLVGAGGFERLVAIKRAHSAALAEKTSQRFLREARLAASVHHANVVGIHQVGEDQDGLYLACDYVEGEGLDRLIESGGTSERLPIGIAMRIVLDALSGLHAAHETVDGEGKPLGLLHRDVSIENLLVGRDGVTRLTDFGIAKSNNGPGLTDAGTVQGKLMYLTPEYLQGAESQRYDDTYAMGITLWIALSGALPYRARDNAALTREVLSRPIPTLSSVGVSLGPLLEACVVRAVSRDPAARFQTARAMLDALEEVSKRETAAARQLDVADFVERAAGEKLAQRRATIQASRTAKDSAAPAETRRSARAQDAEAPAKASAVVFDTLEDEAVARGEKNGRHWLWLAGPLVAGALLVLWFGSKGPSAAGNPRRAPAASPGPAGGTSAEVPVSAPKASAPSESLPRPVGESAEQAVDASALGTSTSDEREPRKAVLTRGLQRTGAARGSAREQDDEGGQRKAKPSPAPPSAPALDITTDNPYR